MRKTIIANDPAPRQDDAQWLDLASLASVEVTSEHPDHAIEGAFHHPPSGWRAGAPGEQTIRLVFDQPTAIRHIRLLFEETQAQRTQEFALSYRNDSSSAELVRQQWSFSPQGSTREQEDYHVDLQGVRSLELKLKADLQPDHGVASLTGWWVA